VVQSPKRVVLDPLGGLKMLEVLLQVAEAFSWVFIPNGGWF
jgi:hypothetical protein